MSVCNNSFKFSNFEKLILKYLKKFTCHLSNVQTVFEILLPLLLLRTPYESSIFVFFFFRFSSSTRRTSPKAMITFSSQRSIPTTVNSGSSTLQNRSVKLLDYSSGISGYNADFHEGHGTAGAGQGRGMACVN